MKAIQWSVLLILASIPKISMKIDEEYIYYKAIGRYCLPYYNCLPGYEILPCVTNYDRDICEPCPDNVVQPDLISSSLIGDSRSTLCFQPTSECLAQDITYRRVPTNSFCDSMSGCKCDTTKCYYGDPCLCDDKDEGCSNGTTLNSKGECVPCPRGTMKNNTGCGPCRTIEVHERRLTQSSDNQIKHNVSRGKNKVAASHPSIQRLIKEKTEISTMSLSTLSFYTTTYGQDTNDGFLIISIAVLGFLAFVVLITVLCVCARRYRFTFGGFWSRTNDPRREHNGVNGDVLQLEERVGFIEKEQHANETRNGEPYMNFDTDNPKTGPGSDFHHRIYPDLPRNGSPGQCQDMEHKLLALHAGNQGDSFTPEYNPDGLKWKQPPSFYYKIDRSNDENGHCKKNTFGNIVQTKECEQAKTMYQTNRDFLNLSPSCSPVTTISDPLMFTKDFSHDTTDTDFSSGYTSQQSFDTSITGQMASGTYITMNALSESSSGITENITSDVKSYPFTMIKSSNPNDHEKQRSITTPKYHGTNGLNSIDSGVSV